MRAEARFTLEGRPEAVRAAIALVMKSPPLGGLDPEHLQAAELVLAEVLNNIVEHAYRGEGGRVDLHLRRRGGRVIYCQISDYGRPLASGVLPAGVAPRPEELAEGGYGWFLIRSLARDLCYFRQGNRNTLGFSLPPAAALRLRDS